MSHSAGREPRGRYLATLSLASLGIVFGDIGTSPLYALRECFSGPHAIAATPANILGVLSLIFWALILVISVKYQAFVLRADNRGEGGILALTALVAPLQRSPRARRSVLILLGVFGTALLYGDGIITPAISVLSAVEGLSVAAPFFDPYVLPITIAILVGLFALQRNGTARVGALFGPVTLVWFSVLFVLGIFRIVDAPSVLRAVHPGYAIDFFAAEKLHAFVVLGAVFLVVTGGEALYADMGHFGRRPIRLAWFAVVLPALVTNYFGQGALLMVNPAAAENPFYRLAPAWALYPLIALSTAATVIASQALITGAFSLTMQAVQLGYAPRMEIAHTSASQFGQIYVPGVNWALMAACVGVVLGFQSSSNLAAAYGIAVTSTMVITALLFFAVARSRWHWPTWLAALVVGFFLVFDLAFFGANIVKIPNGGWFPIVVAALIFILLVTWKRGRTILAERLQAGSLPIETFLESLRRSPPTRVPGTAIFMSGNVRNTPHALLHSMKHYKVLHERTVFLAVQTEEVAHVPERDRVNVESLGQGFYAIELHYGFMQEPDVPAALRSLRLDDRPIEPMATTYFLGRETLIPTDRPGMAAWRERLFASMSRNARPATAFFRLPPNRVVELGAQIEL